MSFFYMSMYCRLSTSTPAHPISFLHSHYSSILGKYTKSRNHKSAFLILALILNDLNNIIFSSCINSILYGLKCVLCIYHILVPWQFHTHMWCIRALLFSFIISYLPPVNTNLPFCLHFPLSDWWVWVSVCNLFSLTSAMCVSIGLGLFHGTMVSQQWVYNWKLWLLINMKTSL